MKRNFPAIIIALMFLFVSILQIAPVSSDAAEVTPAPGGNSLVIATVDNRPISVDRLLYAAFKDIGYTTTAKSSISLESSYEMANNGEIDGVISSTPNMEQRYPNLIRVPVVLEENNISVYAHGNDSSISDWRDLSGAAVGILSQRVYIREALPRTAAVATRETVENLLAGLAHDDFDYVVMARRSHETVLLPDGVVNIATIETLSEFLYVNEKYAGNIPDFVKALENVFADGRGELILNDQHVPGLDTKNTILHIVSSNTEVNREDNFAARLRELLSADETIDWYSFALNARRFPIDASRTVTIAQMLRQNCATRNIAAIIVSGENAMKLVRDYYQLFFRNVPVIFYGIESDFEEDTRGFSENCTGIVEALSAFDTAELALELFPNTKNLYVINDFTLEGAAYRAEIESQLKPLENDINIIYNDNITRDAIETQLRELPSDSIVMLGSYYTDSRGQYYSQNDTRRKLGMEAKVPIFTLYSPVAGYGGLGGKTPDYTIYAEKIAQMLQQLLQGTPVSEVPLITESAALNRWVFDFNALERWGLSEKSLPEDAIVVNKTISIWESDPMLAYAMVALIALGIIISVGITIFLNVYARQKAHLKSARELLLRDEKLSEVKDRLERIINAAQVAFVLTIDGVAVETNEYTEKSLGVKKGQDFSQFYVDPNKRDDIVGRALTLERVEDDIISFSTLSGEVHRFLSNVSVIEYEKKQAFILWAMDIEERERQKDKLQLAQLSLQRVLDALPVPIRISTLDDRVLVYANNAASELFGVSFDTDYYGKKAEILVPEYQPDGTLSSELLEELYANPLSSIEIVLKKKGGELFDCQMTSCHIDYNGHRCSLGILMDLTAEKEYARMLQSTAEKEKEANVLKSRFLVNMSHEIRTPMNAIIGLSEIELRKNPPREVREVYSKISGSAKNLLQIINDILDLSKIEADKIELYDDEFELEEVISSALLVVTPRLDGKNVELMLNVSLNLPRYLIGDRTRLWQILKNFLDNAAKYTESGKIILSVFEDKPRSTADTAYVTFIVDDTGIGISEDEMRKLFVPYSQIYNDAQKRYTGSGLGLAISKRLCEMMGGELHVDSTAGKGTSIFITLPFKRSADKRTEMSAVNNPTLEGLRVLAVDDDEISLSIMETLFEANGAVCDTASSGEDALDMIFSRRSDNAEYDVILLDYLMHGISGLETARKIRGGMSNAPRLLMVTAYQRLLLSEEIKTNGIDEVIEKPFIPSQFIQKVSAAIGHEAKSGSVSDRLPRFQDAHVLLCEDYFLNQEVAIGIFSMFGVTATVAENGKAGIEILKSGKSFDMIFMDLQMPVMDGYEATRVIRSDRSFDKIPIVSLTADAMKEVVDSCIAIGMNDHIAKPIELDRVRELFLKWLPEEKRIPDDGITAYLPPVELEQDNSKTAIRRFGGNRELYEKALTDFTRELPEEWPDFESVVSDSGSLRRDIHRIKGTAGNLSETELYQSAELLETSLRAGSPDKNFYERFINACNALKTRMSLAPEEIVPDNGVWAEEELNECLERMKTALLNYDPRNTTNAVKELRSKRITNGNTALFSRLCELASRYEFDSALDALYSLRGDDG